MNLIKTLKWHLRSVIKEGARLKFKSIFRYLWDSAYRKDVDHLCVLTSRRPLRAKTTYFKLNQIHPSHAINYPGWVRKLETELIWSDFGAKTPNFKPIKIIFDYFNKRFIVVDGNHRLAAMKNTCHGNTDVQVILLIPEADFARITCPVVRDYQEMENG